MRVSEMENHSPVCSPYKSSVKNKKLRGDKKQEVSKIPDESCTVKAGIKNTRRNPVVQNAGAIMNQVFL